MDVALVAIGYIRRSKESGARTVSLEDQRAQIETYAAAQGWQLAEVVSDDGISGGRRERLERLAERVRATGARAIVVYHLDRFARDLAGTLDYLRSFSRHGVELHVVGRGRQEADTASGFIVTAVEGLVAEHYRRVISEKTKSALALVRARGQWLGGAPLGFTLQAGRLVADPEGQRVVDEVLRLQREGLTVRAIGLQVNLPKSTVHKVLVRDRRQVAAQVGTMGALMLRGLGTHE